MQGEKFANELSVMTGDWPADFDVTLDDLNRVQAELHYKQAQAALRQLLRNLDLSAEERAGLEAEIDRLADTLEKLEQSVVQIAAFGLVGRGKSSVLNALLGKDIFLTGPLHGVTRSVDRADWELSCDDRDVVRVSLKNGDRSQVQLVDTPGIDEVDGETREFLAREVARQADLILFVVAGDISKVELEALSQLRDAGKPMLLVFNKIDQYPDADRQAIFETIRDRRVRQLLSPEEIVTVAAAPLVKTAVRGPDGRLSFQSDRGRPQIDALKLKILDLLDREGKSLLALNSLLFADELNDRLLERKRQIRAGAAEMTIRRAVTTKAAAVALNPVTVLDLFTGAAIDVALILALSRLYRIPMTQSAAIALLRQIALGMGGIGASELLAVLGLGSLKGLLGLSVPVTGGLSLAPLISVAATQAGVAGVSTYAIGRATAAYLANGASWGPDGTKTTVRRILDSLDETSILNRLKDELAAKLQASQYGKEAI